MKLHIPAGLRKALMTCLGAVGMAVTVSAGSMMYAGMGAVVSFTLAQQVVATEEEVMPMMGPEGEIEYSEEEANGTTLSPSGDVSFTLGEGWTGNITLRGSSHHVKIRNRTGNMVSFATINAFESLWLSEGVFSGMTGFSGTFSGKHLYIGEDDGGGAGHGVQVRWAGGNSTGIGSAKGMVWHIGSSSYNTTQDEQSDERWNGAAVVVTGNGTIGLSSSVFLEAGAKIVVDEGSTFSLSAATINGAGVVFDTNGTLELSGNSTLSSGGFTVQGHGEMNIVNITLGNGKTITVNEATLSMKIAATLSNLTVNGSGSLRVNVAGNREITGRSVFNVDTEFTIANNVTLTLGEGGETNGVTGSGQITLTAAGSKATCNLLGKATNTGIINIGQNVVLELRANEATIAGLQSSDASAVFQKQGDTSQKTITIDAAKDCTYNGTLKLAASNGTFTVAKSGVGKQVFSGTVGDAVKLQALAGTLELSGTVEGSHDITIGGGKLSFTGNHERTLSALTFSSGATGTLELSAGSLTLDGAVQWASGATLSLAGGSNLIIGSSGSLDISSGSLAISDATTTPALITITITGESVTSPALNLGSQNVSGLSIALDGLDASYFVGNGVEFEGYIRYDGTDLAFDTSSLLGGWSAAWESGRIVLTKDELATGDVTWTGGDTTWSAGDADSWNTEFRNGMNVTFGPAGAGEVSIQGTIETGDMVINEGAWTFTGADNALLSVNGPLSVGGEDTSASISANMILRTVEVNNGSLELNGNVTGGVSIRIEGEGSMSYGGSGTLKITQLSAQGQFSSFYINGGIVDLADANVSSAPKMIINLEGSGMLKLNTANEALGDYSFYLVGEIPSDGMYKVFTEDGIPGGINTSALSNFNMEDVNKGGHDVAITYSENHPGYIIFEYDALNLRWGTSEALNWVEKVTGWIDTEAAFFSKDNVTFIEGSGGQVNLGEDILAGSVSVVGEYAFALGENALTSKSLTVNGAMTLSGTGTLTTETLSGSGVINHQGGTWSVDDVSEFTGTLNLTAKGFNVEKDLTFGENGKIVVGYASSTIADRFTVSAELRADVEFNVASDAQCLQLTGSILGNVTCESNVFFQGNNGHIGGTDRQGEKTVFNLNGHDLTIYTGGTMYIDGAVEGLHIIKFSGASGAALRITADIGASSLSGSVIQLENRTNSDEARSIYFEGNVSGVGSFVGVNTSSQAHRIYFASSLGISGETSFSGESDKIVYELSAGASLTGENTAKIIKEGACVLTLSGNLSQYTGALDVRSGVVNVNSEVTLSGLSLSGGTLNLAATLSLADEAQATISSTLNATQGGIRLGADSELTLESALNLSSGTLMVNGTSGHESLIRVKVASFSASAAITLAAGQYVADTLSGLKIELQCANSEPLGAGWAGVRLFDFGSKEWGDTWEAFCEAVLSCLDESILDEDCYFELGTDGRLRVRAEGQLVPDSFVWNGGADGEWADGCSGWVEDAPFVRQSDVIFRANGARQDVTIAEAGTAAGAVTIESGTGWVFSGGSLSVSGNLKVGEENGAAAAVNFSNSGVELGGDIILQGSTPGSGGAETSRASFTAASLTGSDAHSISGQGRVIFTTLTGNRQGLTINGGATVEINNATAADKNLGGVNIGENCVVILNPAGSLHDAWKDTTAGNSYFYGEGSLVLAGRSTQVSGIGGGPNNVLGKALKAGQSIAHVYLGTAQAHLGLEITANKNSSFDLSEVFSSIKNLHIVSGSALTLTGNASNVLKQAGNVVHIAGTGLGNDSSNAALCITGNTTIAADLQLSANATVHVGTAAIVCTLNGAFIGNAGYTFKKKGAGTLKLMGSVSGESGAVVEDGTLLLSNAASDGSAVAFDKVELSVQSSVLSLGLRSGDSTGDAVWVGSVSGAGHIAAEQAATLKLSNTQTETTAVTFAGTVDEKASVVLTKGAWKFNGTGTGALKVTGASLLLGGSAAINGGLTVNGGKAALVTGSTVSVGSVISLGGGMLDLSEGSFTLAQGAGLSVAVAGYSADESGDPALKMTSSQLSDIVASGISITLTGADGWTDGSSLYLLSLTDGLVDGAALHDVISIENLASDLEYEIDENGVLRVSAPPEPDTGWVWHGDDATDGSMVWSSSTSGWNKDDAGDLTPNGKDVVFEGLGTGKVTVEGDVTPRSVWVKSGSYEFVADEGEAGLNIGADAPAESSSELMAGELAVGGKSGAEAELRLSLANKNVGKVSIMKGGTLTLNHKEAIDVNTQLILSGGVLAYEAGAAGIADISKQVSASGQEKLRVRVNGVDIAWGDGSESRADNSGIALAVDRGIEKTGNGGFTLAWEERADAELAGSIAVSEGALEYVLSAKGHTVRLAGDGAVQLGNAAGGEAKAVFAFAAGHEGTLDIAKAIAGQGVVQIGSASDVGEYVLTADNSKFAGTLQLRGNSTATGGAVVVGAPWALGGRRTTLSLAGRSIVFAPGTDATVAVKEIVVENGATVYVGGMAATASNAQATLSADVITGSGTLANATGGFAHTLRGDLSGFTGAIVAGAAGAQQVGESVWTLSGSGGKDVQAQLAGSGKVTLDYRQPVRLTGRIGSDDAADNSVSLENRGAAVVIADVGADGLGKNTSSGALTGHFMLGDARTAGTWAGSSLHGKFELVRGRLQTAITDKSPDSTLRVETANTKGGAVVHAGNTKGSMFDEIVIHAGGQLKGVGGSLRIGTAQGTTSTWLCFDSENVSPAANSSNYLIELAGTAKVEDTQGFVLDMSAGGFVAALNSVIQSDGSARLHVVSSRLEIDPQDYEKLLVAETAGAYTGDSMLNLLHNLGFAVKEVQGGDILLAGSASDVYLVTDGERSKAHNVDGYNVLNSYKATVVAGGKTLTLALDGAPQEGADLAAGGAVVHNLVGEENATFLIRNASSKERAAVVLNNTIRRDIENDEGYGELVRAQNTVFEGNIRANKGVDLIKTGAGTLTIGSETTQSGELRLMDGCLEIRCGGVILYGKKNAMRRLALAWQDEPTDGEERSIILSGGVTETDVVIDAAVQSGGAVSLQGGARLNLHRGNSGLTASSIIAGDSAGGTLSIGEGASLSLTQQAHIEGIDVQLQSGSALNVFTAGNSISSLSGHGALVGESDSRLMLTGASSFSGMLSGSGSLAVAKGAALTLSGVCSKPDADGRHWSIVNEGSLTFKLTDGQDALRLGSLTLASGSVTTLSLDTDKRESGGLLGGDSLSIEKGATLVVFSSGKHKVDGSALTLAEFDGTQDRLQILQSDIKLKGLAFSHAVAQSLYFEDGKLMLALQARRDNIFATPGMQGNVRAGADLLWQITEPGSAGRKYMMDHPDGHLYGIAEAAQSAGEAGSMAGMERTLAGLAGASAAALSSALAQDMQRQMSALRNRALLAEPSFTKASGLQYHLWMAAEGAYHKQKADGWAPGFSLSGWGATVGTDIEMAPQTTIGLAITAMYNDLKTDSADSGRGDLDTTQLSAYARTTSGAWTHVFVGSVGMADLSFDRRVSYGAQSVSATSGSTDGYSVGLMYELGYALVINEEGTSLLQPVLNVQYTHVSLAGYSERGSDAGLHVKAQKQERLTLGLGVRWQSLMDENAFGRTGMFEARLLLKADMGDRKGSANTSLLYGDQRVKVEGAETGALGVEAGLGISLPLGQQLGSIFFDASAEVRSGYTNLSASAGYRFHF